MDFVIIKRDSQEWINLWDKLSNHPINENIEEPNIALNNGETWQYLGTYKNKDKLISEFRHRNHPAYNNVQKVVFEHDKDFDMSCIEVSKKVK
jgi:hypothetical protein